MRRARDAVRRWAREWEQATRLTTPETCAALARRWAALPDVVRTPQQILGRAAVGCEGTHGVFPRCNLTCSPCYHSADANKVPVDGEHTVREVTAQMALLRAERGPRARAQLIGGEVTLLDADDHAASLLAMRAAGREPMSMTHGDVEADYLERLVSDPDDTTGRRLRLRRVSFAAHFDSMMRGRRGAPRPRREADLHAHRREFVEKFRDLRRRRGLRSYLAHNMTVTSSNLDQVGEVVDAVAPMGFQMLSFQPAARVGDPRRWHEGDPGVSIDQVWERIEGALGHPVPWRGLQFGHTACNRTAFGVRVAGRWVPLLDPDSPVDLALRDRWLSAYGGVQHDPDRPALVVLQVLREAVRHPRDLGLGLRWARAMTRRSGGPTHLARAVARRDVAVLTFVVHAFMDAATVRPAWDHLRAGTWADAGTEPDVAEAQDRLSACVYSMAHPETGELVPACVQHSVLDAAENADLRVLLPLPTVRPLARSYATMRP